MLGDSTTCTLDGVVEQEDVNAILIGLFNANAKLDEILGYLYGEDDGEEAEEDLS